MEKSMTKYFNPYTDFGFKKLFGEEGSKDLLIDFLNQLLPLHHQIAVLTFKNAEVLPDTKLERKAIFDIYCESKSGEKFIVEMQKAKMEFFKDRALFYSMFPIREQAQKGEWNFELLPIYFVAILDFEYDEKNTSRKFMRDVYLKDQDGEIFYEKLHFKFLQMPLFNKKAHELENRFEKWVYFLKNLESFDHIPSILNESIFQKGFGIAELSHLTTAQHEQYQKSLIQYWDVKNVTDTAFKDGKQEGRYEEKMEIVKGMLAEKLQLELIAKLTGLTLAEIENLNNEIFEA
jgi:predicted transposase/invertase (TIGR01784 family)